MLRRHFMRDGLLARVWIGRVVADDAAGLWLWVASGSAFRDIGAADGRAFRAVPFAEWLETPKMLHELTWSGDVLMFHPSGEAHSVWHFFDPDGTFAGYYVNLEEPAVRWDSGAAAGLDTVDQDLDIVTDADRSWRWKDEQEFADHLAHPSVYWVDDSAAVWAEGDRVAARIEAGAFPFDGARTGFRPNPEWTVPAVFPPGWDRPRAWRRHASLDAAASNVSI
jgi:hypothetical protein